ncbi:MAG: NHL repeat-containing protein [Candidatus Aminicenantes bacterium]|nr:NHL repeat-containing protein [Candidatus Aminicenantes bacterium]MDH5384400.1 NHL repeat-containing protein [Candidatus Aminicenantes bacterium]MDH5743812.1 NHL repeat-containing protein [Candidatus Aminicenantes bacterium]
MKMILKLTVCTGIMLFLVLTVSSHQKIETKEGIRLIHNEKNGKWSNQPKVSLEYVKNIGDLESEDESVLFYMPSDIAVDDKGNVYVLDSGNHRIQKFDPKGHFLASFGRQGQGPGEFQYPQSIDIDAEGNLYVSDSGNQKIQIIKPEGSLAKEIKMTEEAPGIIRVRSGQMIMGQGASVFSIGMGRMDQEEDLPKLIKILNMEAEVQKELCEQKNYKDVLVNRMGNRYHFTVDKESNIYVAFAYQNRIEKYSPEGSLLWVADRKLNYDVTTPKAKGERTGSGGRVSIRMPEMNRVSSGIAVEDRGRVWVVTLKRQLREDEQVQSNVMISMTGGQRSMNFSVSGNTDERNTDAYLLEVYDPEGVLLGSIELDKFVDGIHIEKDRIFLLDQMRGMQYYEYKILEK